jgi:hypothetical protein
MDKNYKRMTDYLVGLGIDQVSHTTKTYLGHLVAVYRLMEANDCTEEVCQAGMFHSIYGTQKFQGFKLPLEKRSDVRELIGDRAERLAYLNCAMFRPSFDKCVPQPEGPYRITDRITDKEVVVNRVDFDDLARVHLFDWLEQVPRVKYWNYRREGYRGMATRLGGSALTWYDKVFAAETNDLAKSDS